MSHAKDLLAGCLGRDRCARRAPAVAQQGPPDRGRSIPCDVPAPHNDRALRITPEYPGVDNPDAVRHDVDGTVTEYDGRRGTIEGTITTVHCDTGDEIYFAYTARFVEAGDDVRIQRGTWEITGGTGIFSDLDGEGTLSGRLTCLPLVLEGNEADSCEELGAYSDAVLRLRGSGLTRPSTTHPPSSPGHNHPRRSARPHGFAPGVAPRI